MKKFRPLNAGYIVVYVVVLACILQGVWTLIAMIQRHGAQDQSSLTGMLLSLIHICIEHFSRADRF